MIMLRYIFKEGFSIKDENSGYGLCNIKLSLEDDMLEFNITL